MEKEAIKDILYGALTELMYDNRYFYRSAVGVKYSNWTEAGTVALAELMLNISNLMYEAEQQELDRRAKEMVMNSLKGDLN